MKTVALIVAAGRGTRAGPGAPKQWRALAGRRVIDWTLAAFDLPEVTHRAVVIHPDDATEAARLPAQLIHGGATRSESVCNGLEALADQGFDAVLVHDAARATTPPQVIRAVLAALARAPAAAPALPVTDALWTGAAGKVTGTQPREGLYRAQTPQGFHFDAILAAHRAFEGQAADDVEVARAHGLDVTITPGHEDNLKITLPGDFDRAEGHLKGHRPMRIGNGYDVHQLVAGDHVVLCGVKIPHDRALKGHSDADVGMHALTDAIYGALARGDIGQHFPPSDPQWKGAESHIFLRHAVELAAEMGYRIGNVDVTLICEQPKIGPHAGAMRAELARITGVDVDQVSVKATTSERLGFTGRSEGIAAQASALLVAS
ncbi:bifunctional 2-C-methyl-D-erythritol 4-phosphate cytidylyltransferase/2-C-methyl-D-erythritol 2,4-cyclodiphosphate synthase [Primorskyibacter aestuariivivens]|uniref:bifunctional 2-C-methyl-D-erythritol 4-phosphate cytidylyltransferase/2-C-methyl-D-erythritol 2,4-cyclodiphosphate synthase n=1 Tax=Primorskyibacter aestuariivivens TaxID=1888912 RepID=UPI002300DA05|nr:bifunctional 2-C-methyl-D-erythritol 4-phosphate cytidylyltransferase/2-C-methyl-D-erythritol 2,4-cyclodiphosphate synthase [Primorskyibacter aestuariivivens]MDA7426965.1 bifunctional 2-C-methyl-D-erythritol 4-phosphate cytidylyltransferase/2-C-methyl-D-erythritol 2,4-cyclodiphosphate synthase [Primorskyibacter aestuariivivens]